MESAECLGKKGDSNDCPLPQ